MSLTIKAEQRHAFAGIWKFRKNVSTDVLVQMATRWREDTSRYTHVLVRWYSGEQKGISFVYLLKPDERMETVVEAMTDDEIKITFLEQVIFDAGHDQRGVAFADFGDNHADGETALLPEGASHEVGAIVQFAGGFANAFLRDVGNGLGGRGTIDNQRDGGGREIQAFGKSLEADGSATIFRAIFGLGMIGRGHKGVLAGSLSYGRRRSKRGKREATGRW